MSGYWAIQDLTLNRQSSHLLPTGRTSSCRRHALASVATFERRHTFAFREDEQGRSIFKDFFQPHHVLTNTFKVRIDSQRQSEAV